MSLTLQDFQGVATFSPSAQTLVFSGYIINSLKDISAILDNTNGLSLYRAGDLGASFNPTTQTLTLYAKTSLQGTGLTVDITAVNVAIG